MGVRIAQEELAEFAVKVISLLNNTADRSMLGVAGREYALGWSAVKQAERMLSFYQTTFKTYALDKQAMALTAVTAK
jgi:hypothetical protein